MDLLKNRMAGLERQVTEKDVIIRFLSKQLINKNRNGDSCANTNVKGHSDGFHLTHFWPRLPFYTP